MTSPEVAKNDLEAVRNRILNDLPSYERETTVHERKLFTEADELTSAIMEIYNFPAKSIPEKVMHVIPEENSRGLVAFTYKEPHNVIVVPENPDDSTFRLQLIHELFHMKGINFLPMPLTEAIIERLTAHAENLGNEKLQGSEVFSGMYTYPECDVLLTELIQKIIAKAPPEVQTSDLHTFSYFAKAHLTGDDDYLSFLDVLFGPGTLQRLDELDDRLSSFDTFVKEL